MTLSNARYVAQAAADPQANLTLPGWLYHDAEFFAVERARVLRPAWQIVCHVSDVAEAGDWHTLDYIGENILVVRGDDGVVRAFANVCRHRASRLVDGASGSCRKLVCPYHAWTYELDGRLSGVPARGTYADLDMGTLGLATLDLEVWQGFIFVRLEGGGVSVADMMATHLNEILPYRFEDLRALRTVGTRVRHVNWKNLTDNYSDGLHVPVAHPGLRRLFGPGYGIEAGEHVDRLWGPLVEPGPLRSSERLYRELLPQVAHLDTNRQSMWLYFKLWPNLAFDIHPDQIDFMQFLPISPTETLIREISYAIPDDRREMRAARYLNWRINRMVNREDAALVTRVQAGMTSASYTQGPLGETEVCLRSFAKRMRELVPEARLPRAPAPGWSHRISVAVV